MSDSTALCKRNKDRAVLCIFCASSRSLAEKCWGFLTLVKSVKKLAWNMHYEMRTEISDLFSFFERTRRTGVLSFFRVFPPEASGEPFAGTMFFFVKKQDLPFVFRCQYTRGLRMLRAVVFLSCVSFRDA